MLTFTIPGPPRGKGRPRAAVAGGHARMYTDKATASYESLVRLVADEARGPLALFEGPVGVSIHIVLSRPKRLMRKADPAGLMVCGAKPDTDNVVKAILDGCAVLWRDDAQVARLEAWKDYAEKDLGSRVTVRVWAL